MKFTYLVVAALAAILGSADMGLAQDNRSKTAPAEFPPASYTSSQYVDSRGCVYVRAGVDGSTTWVPRLTRQRKHICGMEPTKVAGTTATLQRTGVEQITLDSPATAPETQVASASLKPKARPARVDPEVTAPKRETEKKARKVAKAKVKVAKAKVTAPNKTVKRVQVAPQPKVRKVEAPVTRAPTPTVATKVVPVRKTKAKPAKVAKAVSAKKTGGLGKAVPSNELAGSTRVVPLHVFRERANRGEMVVPKGYRKAWDDDRLNRRRAEGSLRGRDKMNLVWTNTVPRRLIDRTSGKDVTAKVALVYPYTSRAKQSRELGEVILMSRNGKTVKRIRRNTAAAAPAPAIKTAKPTAKAKSTRAVIATKSSKAAKPAAKVLRAKTKAAKPVSRGQRYVQVGLFGVPSNASATASKLQTMGLPVRISKMTRSGKTLRSVMAGPFADASSVQSALQAVRRAGYADAYLR